MTPNPLAVAMRLRAMATEMRATLRLMLAVDHLNREAITLHQTAEDVEWWAVRWDGRWEVRWEGMANANKETK